MSVGTGLAIASSGLSAIDQQLAVVSQNIANANTSGYSVETANLSAATAGGQGSGVISAPATRQVNTSIQTQVNNSIAQQSYQAVISTTLSGIDQVMGTPGQGNDLPSLLANVQSGFQTLMTDPSNVVQQNTVVSAAKTLTGQINSIASTLQSAGQSAASTITADIKKLNSTLGTIGSLNAQIVNLAQQNKSTADLANQRDAAIQTIASLTGAKALTQTNGSIALFTANGIQLPLNGSSPITATTTTNNTSYSIGGTPVTFGGELGGAQQLINATLPQIQAGLDSFSQALSSRFAGAGLSLFTDPIGNVPTAATKGLSAVITVNPAVISNPALVRDGNVTVTNASGTPIPPNPAGGPAGYTALIQNVLNSAFGTTTVGGSAQPPAITAYTDATGTVSLPYSGSGSLSAIATNLTANEASISSAALTQVSNVGNLVTALKAQASSTSGVNIDQQMSLLVTLQNAYAANAKTVTIAQQMWQAVQAMVQ